MNFKITILFIILAFLTGGIFYYFTTNESEDVSIDPPWFYQVSMDDINFIEVTRQEKTVGFYKNEDTTWSFVNPKGIPPSYERWGGVTLLLSGPQTKRLLVADKIEDPAEYGLDNPNLIINFDLIGGRNLTLKLGGATSDFKHYYCQINDFPELFIISSMWNDVLGDLVDELPYPKWYIKRDPKEMVGIAIYKGDIQSQATPARKFETKNNKDWYFMDLSDLDDNATNNMLNQAPGTGYAAFLKTSDKIELDTSEWNKKQYLVGGPQNITVVKSYASEPEDYKKYGIGDTGDAIELRFNSFSQKGTEFIDGILLKIGDKTEDNQSYYAYSENNEFIKPVLALDANWVESVMDLYNNPPIKK